MDLERLLFFDVLATGELDFFVGVAFFDELEVEREEDLELELDFELEEELEDELVDEPEVALAAFPPGRYIVRLAMTKKTGRN